MRHIQVRVPDELVTPVTRTLAELEVDHVVTEGRGPTADASVVSFPVPTDAVDDVLTALYDAGLSEDAYVVVGSAEAAVTEHGETLLDRYASDFDPLTRLELRSKARDLSRDWVSYVAMIALSAVIATVGLLVGSAAVIVGSMVIAPFVGPFLTFGVGAVTGDREMLVDSVSFQSSGILVAILGAIITAAVVQWVGFVPGPLAVVSAESIAPRIAPGFLSVGVGLVAGGAAALGLSTKGPTALIGVMISAALIPTAAATGISVVWAEPSAIVGSLVLLVATVLAINVGVVAVLWLLEYRPDRPMRAVRPETPAERTRLAALALVVLVVAGLVVWGAVGHASFEQRSTQAVERVLDDAAYDDLGLVAVEQQYGGPSPVDEPRTVTVVLKRTPAGGRYPDLPAALAGRIEAATGRDVTVEVRFVTYHRAASAKTGRTALQTASTRSLGPPRPA